MNTWIWILLIVVGGFLFIRMLGHGQGGGGDDHADNDTGAERQAGQDPASKRPEKQRSRHGCC